MERNYTVKMMTFAISILLVCLTYYTPAVNAARYQLDRYTLARSVAEGKPLGEPIFLNGSEAMAVFLSVDDFVHSYVKFKTITGPFLLKMEWYTPRGDLFTTGKFENKEAKTFNDWWAWSRIRIAGNIGEELYGVWSVKTYLDDELIASARLLVLSPSLIWRYLEFYEETKNTNIALEKTLNEYKQKLEETNREIATLGSRNKELTDALAEARTKHDTLSQEYSKAVSEKHSLQNEVATLKEKLLSTENELNSISMQRLLALLAAGILAVVTVVSLARRKKPSYIPPPPSPTDVKGSLPSSQTKA